MYNKFKNSCRGASLTCHVTLRQGLPPLPSDMERSNTRSEVGLKNIWVEMTTCGSCSVKGLRACTLLLTKDDEGTQGASEQAKYTMEVEDRDIKSLTLRMEENTSTVVSSCQKHVEDELLVNSKRAPHWKLKGRPPLFVGELNATTTDSPMLLKTAERSLGRGQTFIESEIKVKKDPREYKIS